MLKTKFHPSTNPATKKIKQQIHDFSRIKYRKIEIKVFCFIYLLCRFKLIVILLYCYFQTFPNNNCQKMIDQGVVAICSAIALAIVFNFSLHRIEEGFVGVYFRVNKQFFFR